ncbi:hypothetical protein C8J56DRAFT_716935, partial [Mycena floridula]
RSPTPPPPAPKVYKNWETALKAFLQALGFSQTLHGLELDLYVLNAEWEKEKLPEAFDGFLQHVEVSCCIPRSNARTSPEPPEHEQTLEVRKLDFVHVVGGAPAQSPSTITRSISTFLAQSRARNDSSNRTEFLQALNAKRKRLTDETGDEAVAESSCARVDAKAVDRDVQMKYDIAKNDDGPLSRTMRSRTETNLPAPPIEADPGPVRKGKQKTRSTPRNEVKADPVVDSEPSHPSRYSGLDERVGNIETHLAVHYVPSPPLDLLARLRLLEDHIIKLEKEYPPWAALHFNQPDRGWPPPPRSAPVIVPSHIMTSTKDHSKTLAVTATGAGPKARNTKSSLHKAVMDRLEVQQVQNSLSG